MSGTCAFPHFWAELDTHQCLFRVTCFKLRMMEKKCMEKIIALKNVHSPRLGKSLSGKCQNWSLEPKPHKNDRWTWWPFCNFSTWKSETGDPESKLRSIG